MNDFLDKFQKIRSGFFHRMKFIFLLDLISIFSIVYALFIILNVGFLLEKSAISLPVPITYLLPAIAFIIAIIGSAARHKKDKKINLAFLIEKKHPELEEKLRTAYDNRDETNIIVDSLKSKVSMLLDNVSSSHLLSAGKITLKILVTVLFISGALTITLNPDKYALPSETYTNISNTLLGNETIGPIDVVGRPEMDDKTAVRGGGEIFGKPKIASIEGKNIDLTIYSGMGTGFEVRDVSETKNRFIQSADFPVNVIGSNVSDGGYSILLKKTETEKNLIDNYAVERSKL